MKVSNLFVALTGALLMAGTAFAQTPAATPAPASASAPAAVSAPAAAAKPTGEHQMSGVAAYYNSRLNGRKTASGQVFNNGLMTAAHNTLPFGTKVKITNTKNKRSVVVRINDRGPTTPGRIFDLTRAAASKLGYVRSGTADVTAEIVAEAPMKKGKRAS